MRKVNSLTLERFGKTLLFILVSLPSLIFAQSESGIFDMNGKRIYYLVDNGKKHFVDENGLQTRTHILKESDPLRILGVGVKVVLEVVFSSDQECKSSSLFLAVRYFTNGTSDQSVPPDDEPTDAICWPRFRHFVTGDLFVTGVVLYCSRRL